MERNSPPQWPLGFFRWFCNPEYVEEIEGDLVERFKKNCSKKGIVNAKIHFLLDVLKLFRYPLIKSINWPKGINQKYMLGNYLKVAGRNLKKRQLYSLVNVFGLAIGFATCLLMFGFVRFEMSYENHLVGVNNISRLHTFRYNGDKLVQSSAKSPSRPEQVLVDHVASVEATVITYPELCLIYSKDKKFSNQSVFWVSKDFFSVFQGVLIKGNPSTALDAPFKMVLTETKSYALFGDQNPIGKIVKVNEGMLFTVTGIVADSPKNTHFNYDYLLSISTFVHYGLVPEKGNWNSYFTYTYVRSTEGVEILEVEKEINAFTQTRIQHIKEKGNNLKFALMPIMDIHLKSHFTDELEANGDIKYIYIVIGIGVALMLIVWINFVNLSTALSLDRAKETGIRKTFGATRSQLITQHMIEAFLVNLIAFLLAFLSILLLKGFLMDWLSIQFDLGLNDWTLWLTVVGLFLGCVFLASSYPVMIVSSFDPDRALRGKIVNGRRNNSIVRDVLVTLQFAGAIFLIVGAVVVYLQVSYMRSYDLGIDIDRTLVLRGPSSLNCHFSDTAALSLKANKYELFKTALKNYSFVGAVGSCRNIPGEVAFSINEATQANTGKTIYEKFGLRFADEGFFETFSINFLAGEKYKKDLTEQRREIIINNKARKTFGFESPEAALGKKVKFFNDPHEIIGVVEDFHLNDLSKPILPNIFINRHPFEFGYFLVKLNSNTIQQDLALIEETWHKHYPNDPFDSFFSDDYFNTQYENDVRFGQIFSFFTVLAILIANLGLVALTSLSIAERLREISIRKVLGAKLKDIIIIMSRDLRNSLIIASLISIPLAYYLMVNWLNNFSYRIEMPYLLILGCVLFISLIAIINITYFVTKVYVVNPAKTLKDE